MATVTDFMITDLVSASPDEPVDRVARRMADNGVGAVLVLSDGALVGILSERDLLTRVIAEGLRPSKLEVGDVATNVVATVDADATIRDVLQTLRDFEVRHVPVVDHGRPVGILSVRDFYRYLVDGLEGFIDGLRYRKTLDHGVDPYDHLGGSYGR